MFLFIMQSLRREKDHNLKQQLKSMLTPDEHFSCSHDHHAGHGWKFTGAPLQFLSSLANCVLPTSMIIIGCLLPGSPLIDVLKKPILYFITLLRGVVMPLTAAAALRLYRLEPHGVPVHHNGARMQRGDGHQPSSA